MGQLTENIKTTQERLDEYAGGETPAIVQHKDGAFYLASVEGNYVRELHPQTKSKDPSDICKMDWVTMYSQIKEGEFVESVQTNDFQIVSDPREVCKL